MNHLAEYIVALLVSVILMGSLFVFHKFWAKTTKTYWVRIVIIAWMLVVQISFYVTQDIFNKDKPSTFMYWELCNILAWTSIFLMIFPTKLQLDFFMPLAIIGPGLTIFVPVGEGYSFSSFWYYQFYLGHLITLFAYFYIYLFGYTKSQFNWTMIRRSYTFAFFLLTFVMIWNMAYVPNGHNPLEPVPSGESSGNYWGPNYIFGQIINNIGLGYLSLLVQYFLMILVFGPVLLIVSWMILYFTRPIYANCGTEKIKFNFREDILDVKTIFTKQNLKTICKNLINKIKV
ncbi:TMEM164 family acyltransferase [Williamsoniiplasma luminosum]|uniref:TIGR02206 family membrane protein n=1 Tax=Williamsoniiplasma luminosum TaxID=214888 RepID=A0A2S0NJT3_9MOLU|nr:YwaF family protein [Williamsoniiplasma luminosum]AVP49262.1 MAG: hypothetical protein C5T88_01545 [Williamsoniiplasma luminosum]